jgi:uncharacterized protein (DUF849 family)
VSAIRRTVLVKACLNGNRAPGEHPALPVTPTELAREARLAVRAGAGALHVHPRGPDGLETLDAGAVAAALGAIRAAAPGVPVGVSTAAWIEPDPERRVDLVRRWTVRPDFASINLSEPDAAPLADALLELGVGVEAGLSTVDDVEALARACFAARCVRHLIEVEASSDDRAVDLAWRVDRALDGTPADAPRLHHGFGPPTWAVLRAALDAGRNVRVGLEDTVELPDGSRAKDNGDLVAAAVALASARGLRAEPD